MLPVRVAALDAGGAALRDHASIRVKFRLFSFLENILRTGDSHALQSRRRQNPGDQGARATRAPAARILTSSDRKSTRLNSSHVAISYAVFGLKKKRQRLE